MATELGGVRVVMLPDSLIRSAIGDGALWHDFGLRILERAKSLCPGKGPLRDSLTARFEYGPDARIEIGSELQTTSKEPVNLFALVEQGTPEHVIDPGTIMAFEWTGSNNPNLASSGRSIGTSFFWSVTIPEHAKNPFVEQAMQQVVRESGGAAFAA